MTWRDDLHGVRRADLAGFGLAVGAIALAVGTLVPAQLHKTTPAQETQETQVQDAGETYAKTWAWCDARFPYRDDLQEACKWGAYEMIPGPEFPVDEGKTQDV